MAVFRCICIVVLLGGIVMKEKIVSNTVNIVGSSVSIKNDFLESI